MAWRGPGGAGEVLRIAWPLILSNSFWTIQIGMDRVFLGRRSSDDVAAAMAAAMLFWTPVTLLQFTVGYVTTFVAQYTGAGQPRRIGPVVWQALFLAVAGGLAFLLLLPLTESIIVWAGHDPEIQLREAVYFRCLCFAALPVFVTAGVSGFFAGLGQTRLVMIVNAAGLAVNGVLGYAWIFGEWGFAELGIAGAGWAMVLGSYASAVLGLLLLLRAEYRRDYDTGKGFTLDRALMTRLLRYGLPNGVLVSLETLAFTLFLLFVGRMGKLELTASTIAFTLNLPAYLPTMGIGQAVGVVVGQHLGEGRPDLAARGVWNGLWLALVFVAAIALFYVLIPDVLVAIFQEKEGGEHWEAVARLAATLLTFVAIYVLFDAATLVFSNALRGAGDVVFVSVVTLALSWAVMVVPCWLAQECGWGVRAAWVFTSAFPVSTALVLSLRFLHGRWRSMRVIETSTHKEATAHGLRTRPSGTDSHG